jgi:HEAT repeat protein
LRSGTVPLERGRVPRGDVSRLAADDGLRALAGALEHPDPEMRLRAAAVLSEFGDERALRLLRAMTHDRSPDVRTVAVRALGHAPNTEALASLIVALDDPAPSVRRVAAEAVSRALGRSVTPDGIDAGEREALRRWWKDRRLADLASNEGAEL